MMPTEKQIEAAAISDATFDGWKNFHTLSRPQRERYLARAKLALEAAMTAQESAQSPISRDEK